MTLMMEGGCHRQRLTVASASITSGLPDEEERNRRGWKWTGVVGSSIPDLYDESQQKKSSEPGEATPIQTHSGGSTLRWARREQRGARRSSAAHSLHTRHHVPGRSASQKHAMGAVLAKRSLHADGTLPGLAGSLLAQLWALVLQSHG